MDPISGINPKKDSTLAMMRAARNRGWTLKYIEQPDIFKQGGDVFAYTQSVEVFDSPDNWYALEEPAMTKLAEVDVILMRSDPPVDSRYIFTTHMLSVLENRGVLVVNRPQSLRDCNEKMFATEFPELCPPVLISASSRQLRDFFDEHQDIILKPLDGMGGASIFRVKRDDSNLSVIIETLTAHGTQLIMAQRYIPEIREGDKRILLINGEPAPFALARIPSSGETRGNLAAGGTGVAQPLSGNDLKICQTLAPVLREKGLIFVGIDVIGDYLTEINVTSPTCIRELDAQCDLDIAGDLMNEIERQLEKKSSASV